MQLLAVTVILFSLRSLLDLSTLSKGRIAVFDIGFLGVASAIGLLVAIKFGTWFDKQSISGYGIGVTRRDLLDWLAGIVIGGLTYAVPTAVFLQIGGAELSPSPIRFTDAPLLVASIVLIAILRFSFKLRSRNPRSVG